MLLMAVFSYMSYTVLSQTCKQYVSVTSVTFLKKPPFEKCITAANQPFVYSTFCYFFEYRKYSFSIKTAYKAQVSRIH